MTLSVYAMPVHRNSQKSNFAMLRAF
jgi:hypothetical protein